MQDIVDFIHKHPIHALQLLHSHYHSKKPGGKGMSGEGFLKNLGKLAKKIGKKAYQGATKLYDYTNGLPYTASEAIAKKLFKTDLKKYATYRDMKNAYGSVMGDPRKYKMWFDSVSHPKQTFNTLKRYIPVAVTGAITGGPAGAAMNVTKQRIAEDLRKDIKKVTGSGPMIPNVGAYTTGGALNPVGSKAAMKFQVKYPKKAEKIKQLINEQKGTGMSKTMKNILKAAGAVGLVGALAYAKHLSKDTTPVSMPKLDHGIHWESEDIGDDWFGGSGKGKVPKSIEKFVKQHPKIVLKIMDSKGMINGQGLKLAGGGLVSKAKNLLAVLGITAIAGAVAFTKWYLNMQQDETANRYVLKAIYTVAKRAAIDARDTIHGTGLKLAGGGGAQMYMDGLGKISPKIKKALKAVGLIGIPAAIAFAKYISNKSNIDIDDDFGDVTAEEHLMEFGEGKRPKNRLLPKPHLDFYKQNPMKAKQLIRMLGKGQKGKCIANPRVRCQRSIDGSGSCSGSGQKVFDKSKSKTKVIGSKTAVWEGRAFKTAGGLKKSDLMKNKRGKIVSIKQHKAGLTKIKNLKK